MTERRSLSRCGVVGDVHCEADVLELVLDALDALGVTTVLCVGDLVDGAGDADRVLALLEDRGVECVAGNHERWFLTGEHRMVEHATEKVTDRSRAFLETLPRVRHYDTAHGGALLCHGVGEADEAWLDPDTKGYALQDIPTLRDLMLDEDVRFMIGGHTHKHMVRMFPGLTIVNAGTIHRRNDQTFSIIDFDELTVDVHAAEPSHRVVDHQALPIPPTPA
ncbi:MAG: metallophosphoesterase [Myxococcota bacterium]